MAHRNQMLMIDGAPPYDGRRVRRLQRWAALAVSLVPVAAFADLVSHAHKNIIAQNEDAANDTEPSIAIHPTNPNTITIAWMRNASDNTNSCSVGPKCFTSQSVDGGDTWITEQPLGGTGGCFDVSLAYNKDGTKLYLSRIHSGKSLISEWDALGGAWPPTRR